MIQIRPRNLLTVRANDKYYYALVLDKIRLFGGNWVYAFHKTSNELLSASELLANVQPGFHAFVDFIWAKRESRVERLAKNVDVQPYNFASHLKGTNTMQGKADLWFIYDLEFNLLRRSSNLKEEEKRYPLYQRIDDTIMVERIDKKWLPELNAQI